MTGIARERRFGGDIYQMRRIFPTDHEAKGWAIESNYQSYRVVRVRVPGSPPLWVVYTRGHASSSNPKPKSRSGSVKFLVNPPGGKKMAKKRRTPPRYKSGPKKGQFMPKAARRRKSTTKRRKNPTRKTAARTTRRRSSSKRAAPKRRRTYSGRRRNPPTMKALTKMITEGAQDAATIVVGKAATRALPKFVGLPSTGNVGMAIEAAIAIALGYVAHTLISPRVGASILAGGLTAPLEDLVMHLDIPVVSDAVRGSLGRYATPPRVLADGRGNMGRYATPRRSLPGITRGWITSPPGTGIPTEVFA